MGVEDLIGSVWEEYTSQQKQDKRKPKGGGKESGDRHHKTSSNGAVRQDTRGKGGGKADAKHSKSIKLRQCDPNFRLRSAIVGDRGSYVKHIQTECNVKINVNDENGATFFEITAETQDGLRNAEAMGKDLISAAYQKYDEWKAAGAGSTAKPLQGGKGSKAAGKAQT